MLKVLAELVHVPQLLIFLYRLYVFNVNRIYTLFGFSSIALKKILKQIK